jgi:hypothetical protein
VNSSWLPEDALMYYASQGQCPVEVDLECCRKLLPSAGVEAFHVAPVAHFSRHQRLLRHDPDLLAGAILHATKQIRKAVVV